MIGEKHLDHDPIEARKRGHFANSRAEIGPQSAAVRRETWRTHHRQTGSSVRPGRRGGDARNPELPLGTGRRLATPIHR